MMTLKINGHSGCSLDIKLDNHENLIVEKGCKESYVPRLKKQFEKQESAYLSLARNCISKEIGVPYPLWKDNVMQMPYIHGQSVFDYFETASADDIKKFADTLIEYINYELASSQVIYVDKDIFINKLEEVKTNISKNELIVDGIAATFAYYIDKVIDAIKNYDGHINIPMGKCHGDLTFSNIIFTNKKYWLIDFLDSYIESPLQDIVKIRQDTVHYWSLNMATNKDKINHARVKTIFKYIDRRIVDLYSMSEWWKWYQLVQYINILRIVPYVKEISVLEWLLKQIMSMGEIKL